jgi:hypothetical protein
MIYSIEGKFTVIRSSQVGILRVVGDGRSSDTTPHAGEHVVVAHDERRRRRRRRRRRNHIQAGASSVCLLLDGA